MKSLTKLVGLLVLVLSLVYLAADYLGWMQADALGNALGRLRGGEGVAHGAAAPLIAVLLAADLVLPVPSSLVMTASGSLLGVVAGTAASFAGAMAGALLGFGLCRRFGQRAFRGLVGAEEHGRVSAFLMRYGSWAILLSRSVPMLTEIISCVAGLGTMSAVRFCALAAAGTLPLCLVYAVIGAAAGDGSLHPGWALLLAFLLPAAGYGWLQRRPRRSHSAPRS